MRQHSLQRLQHCILCPNHIVQKEDCKAKVILTATDYDYTKLKKIVSTRILIHKCFWSRYIFVNQIYQNQDHFAELLNILHFWYRFRTNAGLQKFLDISFVPNTNTSNLSQHLFKCGYNLAIFSCRQ